MSDEPRDDEDTHCYFCLTAPAVWECPLNEDELRTDDGGGFSLGGPLLTCDRCGALLRADDQAALVDLQVAASRAETDASDRSPDESGIESRELVAIARARVAGDERRMAPHVDPPEIAAKRAEGFQPLDGYTGATDELAAVWPAEHAVAFPDRRSWAGDGEIRWYVRSPWSSVSLPEIFTFIWSHVEHDHPGDPAVRSARLREVLTWSEERAQHAARRSG